MNVAIRKFVTPHGGNLAVTIDPMPSLDHAKELLARHVRSLEHDPMVFDLRSTDLGLSFQTPINRVAWSIVPTS